jgi:hypothetical protein
MKKIFVKISWNNCQPLKTTSFARGTSTAMDGNAAPTVKTADMNKAAERVEIAYANRRNGETGKDEFKNASIDLDEKMHDQADYVDNIANGDATMIHSADFESTTPNNARVAKNALQCNHCTCANAC